MGSWMVPSEKTGGGGTVGAVQPEMATGTGGLSEPRDTLNLHAGR